MIADVTQNLIVRVVPVNTPHKTNVFNEQLGFYRVYVLGNDEDGHCQRILDGAAHETQRGIVPSFVGYGSHSTARIAVLNAMDDYIDKFGALCVADTTEV